MAHRKTTAELKPRSLNARKFREMIGEKATRALMDAFGGHPIYVPTLERLRDSHKLVRAIGREAAEQLCREFGGEPQLYIPTGQMRRKPLRRAKIQKLLSTGKSVPYVARSTRCTEKAVWEFLARLKRQRSTASQIDWIYTTTSEIST